VHLRPTTQTGWDKGAFTVHLTNLGQADLKVQLGAMDAEGACQFSFDPPQVAVPVGQEETVQVEVLPRAPLSSAKSKPHAFTVTVQPAEVPGYVQQVQGEWVQTPKPQPAAAPEPIPVPEPVSTPKPTSMPEPIVPSAKPTAPVQKKRRWFWGCGALLAGLAVAAGAFWLVGNFIYEGLDLRDGEAFFGGVAAGLIVLYFAARNARRIWKN
jgi:hypothetical protein